MTRTGSTLIAILLTATSAFAQPAAPKPDTSPHTVQMVPVAEGVELEVLDWGGSGPPLVFLAGMGFTAHDFDTFAPRFVAAHHVYAITRRGFGASSKPTPDGTNYSADRLGDDVLAVMDSLKLDRPVLAGHSAGGEELSSVASRHPEKLAGVVYLDAAYGYAYYAPGNLNPSNVNLTIDANEIRQKVQALASLWQNPQEAITALNTLQTELPKLDADIKAAQSALRSFPPAPPSRPKPPGAVQSPQMKIMDAIVNGVERFGAVQVPALAIFAMPEAAPPGAAPEMAAYVLGAAKVTKPGLIERYRRGNPSAHVVVIPDAQHAVFKSNPDQVIREMDTFLARLSKVEDARP
jgi:non-heme chloroperoxidase